MERWGGRGGTFPLCDLGKTLYSHNVSDQRFNAGRGEGHRSTDQHPFEGRVEILQVGLYYRNWDELWRLQETWPDEESTFFTVIKRQGMLVVATRFCLFSYRPTVQHGWLFTV